MRCLCGLLAFAASLCYVRLWRTWGKRVSRSFAALPVLRLLVLVFALSFLGPARKQHQLHLGTVRGDGRRHLRGMLSNRASPSSLYSWLQPPIFYIKKNSSPFIKSSTRQFFVPILAVRGAPYRLLAGPWMVPG